MIKKMRSKYRPDLAVFVLLSLFLSFTLSGQNSRAALDLKPGADVIVYSGTTQGNGYNMPATFGWLVTSLFKTYEEGLFIQAQSNNTKTVYVDIASFGGSSSGSAVTVILDAVLSNASIITEEQRAGSDGLITLEGLRRMALTLQFIAYGSTFGELFKLATVVRAAHENVKGIVDRIGDHIPFMPDFIGGGIPKLWSHQMDGRVVVSDFGRLIFTAQNVLWEDVNRSIYTIQGYSTWLQARQKDPLLNQVLASVTTLAESITAAPQVVDHLNTEQRKVIESFQNWQMAAIKDTIARTVHKKVAGLADLTRRFGRGLTPNRGGPQNQKDPLIKTLAQNLRTGFFISVIGIPYESRQQMIQTIRKDGDRVDYKDFRAYILTNEDSAQAILNSEWYRQEIQQKDSLLARYVIAVVSQRWAAINMSAREPRLLNKLAGEMASDEIRIEKLYDPQSKNREQFELISTTSSELANKAIYIMGGFPSQEMNSWFPSLFMHSRVKHLQAEGFNVIPRFFLFGRDLQKGERSFSTDTIAQFFSKGDAVQGEANIADWNAWSDQARVALVAQLQTFNGHLIETRARWDFVGHSLPAMLSGLTPVVYARIANVASNASQQFFKWIYGVSFDGSSPRILVDPHPEYKEVVPPTPNPCQKAMSDRTW